MLESLASFQAMPPPIHRLTLRRPRISQSIFHHPATMLCAAPLSQPFCQRMN